ncbi:mycothiol system anti-sigma-R factor [Nesterenkonia aerolata]|uniref:Mycothiol system anti-sigma-R factor n=1 Tax=Nesterenkonia aerolata TaxID=3074079 RepID=A0ABU2DUK6_9MICC|nr:mycothiol system anti-sigma-R factor [Nesterenkonia sp. LY-0111]MDR8020187.1 mycothiol system anti-sigma-R factor [Nesterenkonia sp. LY-0111]
MSEQNISAAQAVEACCGGTDTTENEVRLERIYHYLDGALSRHEIDEVQTHLDECPECSSAYDLECIIRTVVRRSCVERAPETLKVTIMERISAIRVEAGHSRD